MLFVIILSNRKRYIVKSLTLFSLFKIAIKHLFILILAAVIAATGAFTYCTYFATPRYSATGYIFVTNGSIIAVDDTENTDDIITNSDLITSMNFINTIVDILNTNGIYKEMSEKLDNKYSSDALDGMSSIQRKHDNSLFLRVNFTASDPKEAIRLVNEFLELVPDYINKFVQNSATSITPSVGAAKTYPQTVTTTMLTAVVGAGIVYFILLLIYAANILIQEEEDFKQRFDLPVIGSVPDFTTARTGKSRYSYYKYGGYGGSHKKTKSKNANTTQLATGDTSQNKTPFSVVEAYKSIRVHLLSHLSSINGNTVVVSSPFASDGKSTTAVNIAITLSHLSKKILIIDADFRRSTIHRKLKVTNELGCTDIISGEAKLKDVVKSYNSYLDVLTSGSITSNPSELFVSTGFDLLLAEAKDIYDYVIIDTPPINIVSDTLVVAQKCDSLIIVARTGVTTYEAFKNALDTAKSLNINIMGAILNGTDNQSNKYYRYKYNKYYKKHGYYNYSK